ncbi:hypothetical protein [Absidia glauca]|uniref:Uncharacterized protein n=1 Tax=Absidia glauca TaxID=4829 RepID=A0A163JZ60_ABSGL|nr:hypothetical protein [Absidia glauca]
MTTDDIPSQDTSDSSSSNAPYDKHIPESDRKLFTDYYCDQCERRADFKYAGTLNDDNYPIYKCPTYELIVARLPTTSMTKETSTTQNQIIQVTIQTLQETITQMAYLIAELSPFKQTIAKLEKRVTQLENPSPNTCSKQADPKTPNSYYKG